MKRKHFKNNDLIYQKKLWDKHTIKCLSCKWDCYDQNKSNRRRVKQILKGMNYEEI